MQDLTTLATMALVERDGEPRALDADIGRCLQMARPTNIRSLIEANRRELESFGSLHAARAMIQAGKGAKREGEVFYLNEEQALLISTISKAPNAPAVRAMLIRTFVAWRRGQLTQAIGLRADDFNAIGRRVAAIVEDKLEAALLRVLPVQLEEKLRTDERAVAVAYKPALLILIEKKVPSPKRRAFSQRVSNSLRRFCADRGFMMRTSRESGRWLFPVDGINAWLAYEGERMIRDHIASTSRQGTLALVQS